jgi:hypothetical protein
MIGSEPAGMSAGMNMIKSIKISNIPFFSLIHMRAIDVNGRRKKYERK